jgi:hypothetical protein
VVVLFDELSDVPANCVAGVAHRRTMIQASPAKPDWAFNRPSKPPYRARKYWARPFLLAIAHRYYILKAFAEMRINGLGRSGGNVYPDLLHRGHGVGVQTACFCSGTDDFEFFTCEVAQETFSHLGRSFGCTEITLWA